MPARRGAADGLRCDNHQDLLAANHVLDGFFTSAAADARALHPGNALAALPAMLEVTLKAKVPISK